VKSCGESEPRARIQPRGRIRIGCATAVLIGAVALAASCALPSPLWAQVSKPPSLKEQLEAQYPPLTGLTIRKLGILGVTPSSSKNCPVRYQDGILSAAVASCVTSLKGDSRVLLIGEKVYPSQIEVDLQKERISFLIVECDSCNKTMLSASYKAQIDFQFSNGYLQSTSVPIIEDTIAEVLAFEEGADQYSENILTNRDIMRMAQAKLADGIIVSKIKSSKCDFDTGVDALINLKQAGVSDAVIQVMQGTVEAATFTTDQSTSPESVTTPDSLKYSDIEVGSGATATPGHKVVVHYTGWLTNGKKFDSSVDRGQPFEFGLGAGQVIKGWDEGVAGMKVGGKRRLEIPPALGYGSQGAGGVIPPNATLLFDVELLDVK